MQKSPPQAISEAKVHWDESNRLVSSSSDDMYFSHNSGIDEAHYVFMEQNNLPQRWKEFSGNNFTIGETGFGTGQNFLIAAKAWLEKTSKGTLHFVSVEKFPLSRPDLQQALALWTESPDDKFGLAEGLLQQYPPAVPGIHRIRLANNRIVLTLMYGDAEKMFASLQGSDHPLFKRIGNPVFDAWFLGGFAPTKNQEIWAEELFQTIANLSQSDTTFSTSTSDETVQRRLANVGFEVEKIPDLGNKRDVLKGKANSGTCKPHTTEISPQDWQPATFNSPHQPPWYLSSCYLSPNSDKNIPKTAIVIGGGIAGCSTARALAERGISVTLIERHKKVGQEGSGNPQGILYPKLSTGNSPLARFGLMALLNASRYYRSFLDHHLNPINEKNSPEIEMVTGKRCGVLVLPESENDKQKFEQISQLFPQRLVQLLKGERLHQTAGLPLESTFGLFYPQLGWINPPAACQSLSKHPLISIQTAEVEEIIHKNSHWQALDKNGALISKAPTMVIACSFDSSKFSQTNHLPLKKVRGQITSLPSTTQSEELQTVLCGEGYIAPAVRGTHTLGATYNFDEASTEVRTKDHQVNLEQLTKTDQGMANAFCDTPSDLLAKTLSGRAAFRCTIPDYLPIAGPAPKLDTYLENYQLLRKNARSHIPIPGDTWPNLYLNIGHGSRGLSYAPMCAELIASEICNEVPPLELDLRQAVHPGRFIIRDIKRNKR